MSLYRILPLSVAALLTASACGNSDLHVARDAGADLAMPASDLSVPDDLAAIPDMTASVDLQPALDMSGNACTVVTTWPSNDVEVLGQAVSAAPFDFATIGHAVKTTGVRLDALSVELWHQASTPSPPRTVALPANTDYTTCEICVLVDENYSRSLGYGDVGYLARGGMVTVTKGDITPGAGMMNVSGTNVELVEWDFNNDKPVTNGKCYQVTSFAISGSYSNPDML